MADINITTIFNYRLNHEIEIGGLGLVSPKKAPIIPP